MVVRRSLVLATMLAITLLSLHLLPSTSCSFLITTSSTITHSLSHQNSASVNDSGGCLIYSVIKSCHFIMVKTCLAVPHLAHQQVFLPSHRLVTALIFWTMVGTTQVTTDLAVSTWSWVIISFYVLSLKTRGLYLFI